MFNEDPGKMILSVMKDADKCKKDKVNVATMMDHNKGKKQRYYVLTEEQFDLMFKGKTLKDNKTKGGNKQ